MAATETDPDIGSTFESMATSYDKLVEEAQRIQHLLKRLSDDRPWIYARAE